MKVARENETPAGEAHRPVDAFHASVGLHCVREVRIKRVDCPSSQDHDQVFLFEIEPVGN